MALSDNMKANNGNTMTSYDKLKATEKYLLKMKDVLSTMDEITRIKRANGAADAESDEVGGYKRSSVVKLISELEKQRDMLLSDIEKEKQAAISAKDKQLSAQEKEKREALAKKDAELAA